MNNLKQKTINGMAWSITERISLQVIHVLISIILARLLSPSDFGLFGMLAIFTSISQSILDAGFGTALIRKKDATQTDSSSIFYFNLFIGLILASLFFFSAPAIANFFQQPLLVSITRVLSLNMIINAFSLIQLSMLRKNMEFKKQSIINVIVVIISGALGIISAYKGLGVWSLVIQTLSHSFFRSILCWVFSDWRPIGNFSFLSLKSMFSFGSKLLIAGLVETAFKHLYDTFIGKNYSASELGYYNRASTMESAATTATSMALATVIFPTFSPFQDDNQTLKSVHNKTIKLSMFLHIPLMIGLIVIAEPLLLFLLTDKWANSITYFQLLCVVGLVYPIQVQNYNLFRIKGRSDYILKFGIFKHLLTAVALLFTYRHGVIVLILGQVIVAFVSQLVASYLAGRLIYFSVFDLIKAITPSIIISIAMGIILFIIGNLNIESNLLKFTLQVIIGILIYYAINKFLKSPELIEFVSIVQHFFNVFSSKMKGKLWKRP